MRSRLAPSREQEIVEIAEAVADTHCFDKFICPLDILKAEEIDYSLGAYGEKTFEGMLEFKGGRFFVYCNRDRENHPHLPRGRFTLAHELGHFYIPEHHLALRNGTPTHQSKCGLFDGQHVAEELEADLFAANLLMPPSRFKKVSAKFKNLAPLAAILEIKELFKTSILSTAIQYSSAHPDVVAMVKWNDNALAWKRIEEEYFLHRQYRSWKIDSPAALPKGSASRVALDEDPKGEKAQVHESVSTASFCFHHVASSGNRDLVLREEAVRLGTHGVLTLFSLHPQFK